MHFKAMWKGANPFPLKGYTEEDDWQIWGWVEDNMDEVVQCGDQER